MGESTKAASVLVLIVSSTVSAIAWTADRPDATTWVFRIASVFSATLALALILKLQLRTDVEPDYLYSVSSSYFNRDGFCFTFVVTNIDGTAFMDAYYQSQYDQRSVGRIALRPARGFFLTRVNYDSIYFEIECPPAGFGFVRVAIPLPNEMQGKRQSFEVGASVRYPEGKGQRIRFHDGVFLRSDTYFKDSVGSAIAVAGVATGSIVLPRSVTAEIDFPVGVTENVPDNLVPENTTVWQLGEPTLESSRRTMSSKA